MKIVEDNGDILLSINDGYVVCHCVSLDCIMGNGISYKICKGFKSWNIAYYCRRFVQHKEGGALGIAYKPSHSSVYSLFVKKRHYNKYNSTYEIHLKHGLNDLKNKMIQSNQSFLAMPKLGCGKDRGNWLEIRGIIENIFKDTNFEIKIFI